MWSLRRIMSRDRKTERNRRGEARERDMKVH